MRRVIRAESKEFRILYGLNSKFMDPALYKKVLDNPEADFKTDFDLDSMDIVPTASAEMSSKMQRIQQAEIMILQAPQIKLEGGDTRPIWENWFDAIGKTDFIGQVFIDPEAASEAQKERMAAQKAEQEKADQLQAIDIDHRERQVAVWVMALCAGAVVCPCVALGLICW